MELTDQMLGSVADAAQAGCIAAGSVTAVEVCAATGLANDVVREALTLLTARGELLARPGGRYARALVRRIRLPGASYVSGLAPLLPAALMVAR